MKIEMRDVKHLWVTVNPALGDHREVIIDTDRDVRICDGQTVVKVSFQRKRISAVLVNDVYVYP